MKLIEMIKTLFVRIHNYLFCKKYPFYKALNVFDDKFCGYDSTWYDSIPEGWRKAFGKEFSRDLKEAIKLDKVKNFRFLQIKEKWGLLTIYVNNYTEHIDKVITKYEEMSKHYCIECGKPSEFMTFPYITYLCSDCVEKSHSKACRIEYAEEMYM